MLVFKVKIFCLLTLCTLIFSSLPPELAQGVYIFPDDDIYIELINNYSPPNYDNATDVNSILSFFGLEPLTPGNNAWHIAKTSIQDQAVLCSFTQGYLNLHTEGKFYPNNSYPETPLIDVTWKIVYPLIGINDWQQYALDHDGTLYKNPIGNESQILSNSIVSTIYTMAVNFPSSNLNVTITVNINTGIIYAYKFTFNSNSTEQYNYVLATYYGSQLWQFVVPKSTTDTNSPKSKNKLWLIPVIVIVIAGSGSFVYYAKFKRK